ncbi:MAG: metallopeptidase TldD-related protein [Armatimonadota bacterium]|nr:metallopeptidase TldD-related protein [Armatimonadota bacterium]
MTVDEATRYVLERARARGVAVEVLGTRARETSVRAFQGRVEQLTEAVRGGLGLRVVVDGRVGYAYSEELTPAALEWALAEALENAALQPPGQGFLPVGGAVGEHDLVGDRLQAPLAAKIGAALGFEGTLREDARVKQVVLAGYVEREQEVRLASTAGRSGAYRRGLVGTVGSVVMQQGSSLKQAWEARFVTDVAALDPGRTALDLTERTARLLGARPLRTGRYPAYLEPRPLAALLAAFWPMWSGKMVQEGKSRLRGRLGERVASPLVTLVDDPTLPDGLATRPFDAEGTPARPLTLVEDGVLQAFLTNSETARALGLPNTGHAARSYRGVLGVAPSNLYLAPRGPLPLAQGVLVAEVMGLHAGTNPVTGEFSVQALGLWVEDGAVAYPLENFTVAGDFLDLLAHVVGVGEGLRWELEGPSAFGAPGLVAVESLSFAGES